MPDITDVMVRANPADNGSMVRALRQNEAFSSSKAGVAELAGGGSGNRVVITRVG